MSATSKREEKYIENLKALAARSTSAPDAASGLEQRVAEIRRWEGAQAADEYRRNQQRGRAGTGKSSAHQTASRPVAAPGTVTPIHTNTLAILALIFGIGGGVLGIVFGHVALSQIERSGEEGRGLAIAGLICGYIGLGIILVVFIATRVALARVGL